MLAQADSVVCHITYGGETRLIEAQPVSSPYTVAPTPIGTYFLFRIVFRQEPARSRQYQALCLYQSRHQAGHHPSGQLPLPGEKCGTSGRLPAGNRQWIYRAELGL
jgi:hypothetical protein